jgi:hypothetical protein
MWLFKGCGIPAALQIGNVGVSVYGFFRQVKLTAPPE